jgi:two-component system sensor histidine kinase MprB
MTTRTRFALFASLASIAAVLVAGLIAVSAIDSSLSSSIDDRLDGVAARVAHASSVTAACREVARSAGEPERMVALLVDGREQCRNNGLAPSPRALGVGLDATAAAGRFVRDVDGVAWRGRVIVRADGARVVVAESAAAIQQVRRAARIALLVAIVAGAITAAFVGASIAIPATRRIDRLLDRIRAAGSDAAGTLRVGSVGGRDLDAAARSFDALLDDLRDADAAQRRLFADAAHELRTPLTSMRTNAQLLARDPSLHGDARDMADRIARQVAAIGQLVSGLVDHASVGAWSRAGAREVTLVELAKTAAERARARWPQAQVQVDADESSVHADPELVLRALGNLIDNAVVHGDGAVRVEVADGVLAVEDDGNGFDEQVVDDAFRPFATAADSAGSGLGLAFVEHVARAHGGSASIQQTDHGGARVELRLDGGAR